MSPTASLAAPLFPRSVNHVPTPLTFLDAKPRQTLLADLESIFGRRLRIRTRVDEPRRTERESKPISKPSAPASPPPPYSAERVPPSPPKYTPSFPDPAFVERQHRAREAKQERELHREIRKTVRGDVTKPYGLRVDRWNGNWI